MIAKSTCSPSSSMKRAINGAGPSLRNFLPSDAVGESVTASRTGIRDSAHAAGLPRNANTSCTHTPYPRIHRDLPCRRRRNFTFPGRCRIARLRITRTESPAAHNQSGTPSECKDRPDHRYSLALTSSPVTEPPTRGRRYPDSARSDRPRAPGWAASPADHACRMRIARGIPRDDDRDPPIDTKPAPDHDVPRSGRGFVGPPANAPRPERCRTCTQWNETVQVMTRSPDIRFIRAAIVRDRANPE